MIVQALLGGFLKFYTLNQLFKNAVALLLGATTLGWVVEHIDPPGGTAVVHVVESRVEVAVDGESFTVLRPYSVIEVPLSAGSHRLSMKRDDRILYEEQFIIPPGGDVVLTAYHRD
jgi:hypothetical protein